MDANIDLGKLTEKELIDFISKTVDNINKILDNIDKKPFYELVAKEEKLSVQDYCKKHRFWAAKNRDGSFTFYDKYNKPKMNTDFCMWNGEYANYKKLTTQYIYPTVSWEKSLIAPDGRLILIEGKKPKQKKLNKRFKEGWSYIATSAVENRNTVIINVVTAQKKEEKVWKLKYVYKENLFLGVFNPELWEVYAPPKKIKQKLPERGTPIFCYKKDYGDNCCPPIVKYFHHFDKRTGKVYVYADGQYGVVSSTVYDGWGPCEIKMPEGY